MRAKFVDVNGVKTRYLHEGSGEPLLLVHGAGAFADNFYKNIDALGKEYFVCAPDMVGHGFTEPVPFDGPVYPTWSITWPAWWTSWGLSVFPWRDGR